MILFSLKNKLRPFYSRPPLLSLINLARFFKAIMGAPSYSFRHLPELHQMWLTLQKHENNQRHQMLAAYEGPLDHSAPKRFFRARELQIYSQNGEDGILLYLFSRIGATKRNFVEIGAGGYTSNIINLVRNFGWCGLSLDGDQAGMAKLDRLYESLSRQNSMQGSRAVAKWITRDNVNELFTEYNVSGEIDLLSIDIDGNDYWVWEAINVIQPRIVVIEYNGSYGAELALTVPYKDDFFRWDYHPMGWYHGASLKALETLGKRKGYALICCESSGVNAFFVRQDLAGDLFVGQTCADMFYHDVRRGKNKSQEEQLQQTMEYSLVTIE